MEASCRKKGFVDEEQPEVSLEERAARGRWRIRKGALWWRWRSGQDEVWSGSLLPLTQARSESVLLYSFPLSVFSSLFLMNFSSRDMNFYRGWPLLLLFLLPPSVVGLLVFPVVASRFRDQGLIGGWIVGGGDLFSWYFLHLGFVSGFIWFFFYLYFSLGLVLTEPSGCWLFWSCTMF